MNISKRHGRAACLLLLVLLWVACFGIEAGKDPGQEATNEKDDAVMVWVPAGTFRMGVSDADVQNMRKAHPDYKLSMFNDESPQREVTLDGYWLYKQEVTVGQYRKFCEAKKREMPEQPEWATDAHPVVNVSWVDADAYADWVGASLPTEAQWEKAARGTDGRYFPWGNEWDASKCNNYLTNNPAAKDKDGSHHGSPGGSFPTGVSPFGALDMAGNVWEWCADWYDADYYKDAPLKNPTGPAKGEKRVMRGGSWGSTNRTTRATVRMAQAPEDTMHDCGGFRCVVNVKSEIPRKD